MMAQKKKSQQSMRTEANHHFDPQDLEGVPVNPLSDAIWDRDTFFSDGEIRRSGKPAYFLGLSLRSYFSVRMHFDAC